MTGRVITFYSYRGGVGRTMALASTAWLLAGAGQRVLIMDWDLEAPSLHRYFHPFLKDKDLRNMGGLLDMIHEVGSRSDGPTPSLAGYTATVDWAFPNGGLIHFVPAGRQDLGYAERVSTMDWDAVWHQRGRRFFNELRQQMIGQYDFALLDSATGTANSAGIATIHMPDTVVAMFSMNSGIQGTAAIGASIRSNVPAMRVFPVPTMLSWEQADTVSSDPQSYPRRLLDDLLQDTGLDAEKYWRSVAVPYDPAYAYGETLAPFAEAKPLPGSVLAAYLSLVEAIGGGPVAVAAIDTTARAKVLTEFRSLFTGTHPRSRAFLSYVRDDATRVDQIAAELRRVGVDVWMDRTHLRPGQRWADVIRNEISERDFFIACFSSSYTNRTRTYMNEELLQAVEQIRRRPRDRSWFIPAKLDDCDVPSIPVGGGDTLRSFQSVDFAADWAKAIKALIQVLINAS